MASRRSLLRICATILTAAAIAPAVYAQAYPSKPLHLVVPFAAGGSSDVLARSLGAALADRLGQPVVVENKPGAGGIIAAEYVARSTPDGYTLLFGTIGTHAINPVLKKTMPFDVIKDFTPIGRLSDSPLVLVVNPSLPVHSLRELIDYAHANPNKLSYGSAGIGSISHLAGELFKSEAKVDITHVPYKGGGSALPDLLGNQIDLMLETIPNTLPSVKAGKLRALAISTQKRSNALPNVPTFKESGLSKLDINAWTGLFGPANMPAPVVDRLNAELVKIAKQPDYITRIENMGSVVTPPSTPAQFGAFVASDGALWRKVALGAGVQPE